MIDLNKEAEEFLKSKGITGQQNKTIAEWLTNFANTSKYVQAEKIKFTIEQLYKFRESTFGKGKNIIIELEQQLKQLEDE
jgi:hypothetical protein